MMREIKPSSSIDEPKDRDIFALVILHAILGRETISNNRVELAQSAVRIADALREELSK